MHGIVASFVDATIFMLALGGLSHQLHQPRLALAYWSCWLITVICSALFDNGIATSIQLDYITRILLRKTKGTL
jgi:hypothetical protein